MMLDEEDDLVSNIETRLPCHLNSFILDCPVQRRDH